MARRFFYIAAGVLLLALSYHLGAGTASGQGFVVRPLWLSNVFANGSVYYLESGNLPLGWKLLSGADLPPVPPASLVSFSSSNGIAITDAGEGWARLGGEWQSLGFIPGAPTPALHQSWGQVKARYQNTPGMTVTPGANDR
jgi:hypothetical protein